MFIFNDFKTIDIRSDSIKSIILMYSQDDGRGDRRSNFDKKRKKPMIRVGDDVDSPKQNQGPAQASAPLPSFTFGSNNLGSTIAPICNMPAPGFLSSNSAENLSLVTFNPGSAQSSGGFNQSIDSNPTQVLGTSANMQKISEQRA